VSLNVNGLSIDRRGGKFDDLCRLTKEVNADVMCSQEHNLDTTQSRVRNILYDTTRQHWPRSRLKFGTTPIPFTSQFKPGGTMMLIVEHLTGRVKAHSVDHMGRWVSYTLCGKGSQAFTIISIYQPGCHGYS
jgi:exonuclease III